MWTKGHQFIIITLIAKLMGPTWGLQDYLGMPVCGFECWLIILVVFTFKDKETNDTLSVAGEGLLLVFMVW